MATGAVARAESSYPQEAAVVTTLTLKSDGSQPVALAVNSSSGRIYVANAGSDNVSAIHAASGAVVATIPVGSAPRGMVANPRTNKVYVASSSSDQVTVVDGGTNEIVAILAAGEEPWDLAVDSNTGRLFVANRGDDTVSVIDGLRYSAIGTLSVGTTPTGVAVNSETGRVYVISGESGNLQVMDGESDVPIAIVPLAAGLPVEAWDVAVDSGSDRVYVATSAVGASDSDGGTVVVIDGSSNSVVGSIAVPAPVEALAVDSASGRVYAGSSSDDRLWVIDGRASVVAAVVRLEAGLSAINFDSASGRVHVLHNTAPSISVVSWLPGITLVPGWTYACYFGGEKRLDDALADVGDSVLAVYRPRPEGGYDRWFPDRPGSSTILDVRPGETLFILADDYASWEQEPSEPGGDLALAPGWNSICYPGEGQEAAVAIGEMSDQVAVAYGLAADGVWRRVVPGRPELSTMTYVRGFSSLMVMVSIPQPPVRKEPSAEFLALQAVLEDRVRNYYGDVAICVMDLQTDEEICVNGDVPHRAGCTINMFALFVAVEEFEAGRARPEDWAYWIKIGIGHSSPPQVAVFVRGIKGSLEEGAKRASELMKSWGMKDSVFDHVSGYPGPGAGPNLLTARETDTALVKLYRGELFSPEWTAYTIDRLLDIKPGLNYVLPLFLPAGVSVAHKIGYYQDWDGWVYNDAGIVMMRRGDQQVAYVISYLSQAMPSEYEGYIAGAELSKIVYDWYAQRY